MIKLIGVVIVIVGLLLRFNPLLVVLVAGFATGLAGGPDRSHPQCGGAFGAILLVVQ